MKMVTYYNEGDMTKFANYYANQIKEGIKKPQPDGTYKVSHADFLNWKDSVK